MATVKTSSSKKTYKAPPVVESEYYEEDDNDLGALDDPEDEVSENETPFDRPPAKKFTPKSAEDRNKVKSPPKNNRGNPPHAKKNGHTVLAWNDLRLEGFIKRDPEMAYSPNGVAYTKFSLAVSQGQGKEQMYLRVTCFNEVAEKVAEDMPDRSHVRVEGRLTQRKYEGRYFTEVIADMVELTGRFQS